MKHNQKVGGSGEESAAEYLIKHGYCILARNVRTPYGEIDIIARRDEIVIFVEVKARTSRTYGHPELAVTPRKQAHMLAAAEHYAQQNEIDHWQIDVIAVEAMPGRQVQITHFENALG